MMVMQQYPKCLYGEEQQVPHTSILDEIGGRKRKDVDSVGENEG
jgi:hypothetical protein